VRGAARAVVIREAGMATDRRLGVEVRMAPRAPARGFRVEGDEVSQVITVKIELHSDLVFIPLLGDMRRKLFWRVPQGRGRGTRYGVTWRRWGIVLQVARGL